MQPEQGEEGESRLHRDPQGPTGTHRDPQGHTGTHTGTYNATPFPIPALNPSSAPASCAAASSPRSDCTSPQPPSTVVFCCWGRNKQGNKGNYHPFISAVGFAIKQPPVLQCLGVSQHPNTSAVAAKKSHPYPCTPGNPKQRRPVPGVHSPGCRHRNTGAKWAAGKIQMTQPRPVPGWDSGGRTAFLSDQQRFPGNFGPEQRSAVLTLPWGNPWPPSLAGTRTELLLSPQSPAKRCFSPSRGAVCAPNREMAARDGRCGSPGAAPVQQLRFRSSRATPSRAKASPAALCTLPAAQGWQR